jgi:hypothetical protein
MLTSIFAHPPRRNNATQANPANQIEQNETRSSVLFPLLNLVVENLKLSPLANITTSCIREISETHITAL